MMAVNPFQILNGLTFAALLFIVASGFTLIFGLLRIVNLAHGALYLIGGLVGYSTARTTGSYFVGALAAMAFVAALGIVLEQGLLRFVRGVELRQVLLTLGVAFLLNDMSLVIWGGDTFTVPVPEALRGAMAAWADLLPEIPAVRAGARHPDLCSPVAPDQQDAPGRADPGRGRRSRDGRGHGHQHPARLPRHVHARCGAGRAGAASWGARS